MLHRSIKPGPWTSVCITAAVISAALITQTVRGQGIPMPRESEGGGVAAPAQGPNEIYSKALAESVALARQRTAGKPASEEVEQVVSTLRAIGPLLRPELQAQIDDWVPLSYARFGETDQALAHIKDRRESSVPRLLMVSSACAQAR